MRLNDQARAGDDYNVYKVAGLAGLVWKWIGWVACCVYERTHDWKATRSFRPRHTATVDYCAWSDRLNVCVCFSFYSFPLFLRCLSTPKRANPKQLQQILSTRRLPTDWHPKVIKCRCHLYICIHYIYMYVYVYVEGWSSWLTTAQPWDCGYQTPSKMLGPSMRFAIHSYAQRQLLMS